jgi:hypothetical protein
MSSKKLAIGLGSAARLMALLLILFLMGGSAAGAPLPQSPAPATANMITLVGAVDSQISYQGRLADPGGNPLNGSYNLVFQLWDAASGGNQVGGDIVKNATTVNNGLFTVELGVPQSAFNGQGIWLRVQVDGQWLSPRQALLPVPYALSLRPGALISGAGPVLTAQSDDQVMGELATYVSLGGWPPTFIPIGVRGEAAGSSGIGVDGAASGGATMAVRGIATGVGAVTNYGGYFEAYGDTGRGVAGVVSADQGQGVHGYAAGGSGYGVYGQAAGSSGYGVYGRNAGNENVGYLGGAYGAYGETSASHGRGVVGLAQGDLGVGVFAEATGYDAYAIYARAADSERGVALYAEGPVDGRSAVFKGNVQILSPVDGSIVIEMGEGLDYAEGFHVSDKSHVEPGSVLVIDVANPGQLTVSSQPYDTRVAGIAAGANGLGSALPLRPPATRWWCGTTGERRVPSWARRWRGCFRANRGRFWSSSPCSREESDDEKAVHLGSDGVPDARSPGIRGPGPDN